MCIRDSGNAVSTAMNKAEINGKTTVNVNLALADNTTAYAIYVVDNLTDMQPIAPFKTCLLYTSRCV